MGGRKGTGRRGARSLSRLCHARGEVTQTHPQSPGRAEGSAPAYPVTPEAADLGVGHLFPFRKIRHRWVLPSAVGHVTVQGIGVSTPSVIEPGRFPGKASE